jgi:hypothetical protein
VPARGERAPRALVIVLPLEGAPRVHNVTACEWGTSRLADWILSHDDLAELLDRAIERRESWYPLEPV